MSEIGPGPKTSFLARSVHGTRGAIYKRAATARAARRLKLSPRVKRFQSGYEHKKKKNFKLRFAPALFVVYTHIKTIYASKEWKEVLKHELIAVSSMSQTSEEVTPLTTDFLRLVLLRHIPPPSD